MKIVTLSNIMNICLKFSSCSSVMDPFRFFPPDVFEEQLLQFMHLRHGGGLSVPNKLQTKLLFLIPRYSFSDPLWRCHTWDSFSLPQTSLTLAKQYHLAVNGWQLCPVDDKPMVEKVPLVYVLAFIASKTNNKKKGKICAFCTCFLFLLGFKDYKECFATIFKSKLS